MEQERDRGVQERRLFASLKPRVPSWSKKIASRWRQARPGFERNWDTGVAISLGIVVGLLGVFQVTSVEITAGTTLVVLAAVAGSLQRDRALRDRLAATVRELDAKIVFVSRAFSSPLPYEVISGHYEWDFEAGGEVATVRKQAEVRFVQNGVWTIPQWHSEGAEIHDPSARRLLEKGRMRTLQVLEGLSDPPGKKVGKLIALDREWQQTEVLDFEYSFQSHGSFPSDQEWVEVDIETATDHLVVELLWAEDRVPGCVKLIENGDPRELPVDERGGRRTTRVELRNLAREKKVLVRWEWRSLQELQAKDQNGVDDDG